MEISQYKKGGILVKGRKESVVIGPQKDGLSGKTAEAKVVIFEGVEDNFLGINTGEKVVIWGPGEYEISGIEISGIKIGESGLAYIIQVDGIKVGYITTLSEELTDKKKERLSECDVLIVKGGGEVKEIWEKSKVFGVSYLLVTQQTSEDQKKLIDLADQEDAVPTEILKVEKENLPEAAEVVLLTQI